MKRTELYHAPQISIADVEIEQGIAASINAQGTSIDDYYYGVYDKE